MKIAVLAITTGGYTLARELTNTLENTELLRNDHGIAATFAENWFNFDGFICIMATGIVVRAIAPLLKDKRTDPCILVMDEKGHHVISLLSGHLGGGNALTREVATAIKARPVITTASDVRGLVALDLWAATQNLVASDPQQLTQAISILVNQGELKVYCDVEVKSLPAGVQRVAGRNSADLIITNRSQPAELLAFHPKNLVIGMGCNRGTPANEFEEALKELLADLKLSAHSIRNLASIDVKQDETGLLEFAENNKWYIDFFSKDKINRITNVDISDAAMRAVGAIGVAEPTALLSAQTTQLLSRKRKWQNITMAIAEAPFTLSELVQDQGITSPRQQEKR